MQRNRWGSSGEESKIWLQLTPGQERVELPLTGEEVQQRARRAALHREWVGTGNYSSAAAVTGEKKIFRRSLYLALGASMAFTGAVLLTKPEEGSPVKEDQSLDCSDYSVGTLIKFPDLEARGCKLVSSTSSMGEVERSSGTSWKFTCPGIELELLQGRAVPWVTQCAEH